MSEWVIETQKLTKTYGDFVAVHNLDLQVKEGEIFGLLGPNGSGKTTTILMLLGLAEPAAGQVHVLDMDPSRQPLQIKSRVGYIPDQIGFYDELTARENLIYTAKLNGLSRQETRERTEMALERVGLSDRADQRVGAFSYGMRQRLGVADVLIKQPRLIVMDEPTQGMDPERAHEFLDLIRQFKAENITVLLSSHLLQQVQSICDRVGLFYHGEMVLVGTVEELAQQVLGKAYRIHVEVESASPGISEALKRLEGVVSARTTDSRVYAVEAQGDLRPEVAQAVVSAGGRLLNLSVEAQSLDLIYSTYFQEVKHERAA